MSHAPDPAPGISPKPQSAAAGTGHSPFPFVAGGIALIILLVSCFSPGGPFAAAPTPAATPPAPAAEPAAKEEPAATPAAKPATSAEVLAVQTKLQEELDSLAKHVDSLQTLVDAMAKAKPAPDLEGIQAKVDELAKVAETVTPLPKTVGALGDRLGTADKAIEELRAELASLKEEIKKAAAPPEPTKPDVAAALAPASELFKQTKYADALASFKKVAEANPDDARAWYYAALANGFATGKWDGETVTLVTKGIDREKAGTPDAAQIDAAFAGLTAATGKDWLAGYRARAKK